jgi:psiF repeat
LFTFFCFLWWSHPMRLVLAAFAALLSLTPVLAQTTPPLQPVPNAAPGSVPPAASAESRKAARAEGRKACQTEADAKSLKGTERRSAMRDCMQAKFPRAASTREARTTTRDGQPTSKVAREACKTEIEPKGLKGKERREAMATCFRGKRPDLAARADCRKAAKAKGLAGTELRDAVKACAPART